MFQIGLQAVDVTQAGCSRAQWMTRRNAPPFAEPTSPPVNAAAKINGGAALLSEEGADDTASS